MRRGRRKPSRSFPAPSPSSPWRGSCCWWSCTDFSAPAAPRRSAVAAPAGGAAAGTQDHGNAVLRLRRRHLARRRAQAKCLRRTSLRAGAAIVEAQLGRRPAAASAIPAGTKLRAPVRHERGDAFVDLSGEVGAKHTGGSLDELFTVYAIVNALTVNLPAITRGADPRRRQGSRYARRPRRPAATARQEPLESLRPETE